MKTEEIKHELENIEINNICMWKSAERFEEILLGIIIISWEYKILYKVNGMLISRQFFRIPAIC